LSFNLSRTPGQPIDAERCIRLFEFASAQVREVLAAQYQ
jgi:hypothetical protein